MSEQYDPYAPPPVPAEPRERPLDDPPLGQQLEALGAGRPADADLALFFAR